MGIYGLSKSATHLLSLLPIMYIRAVCASFLSVQMENTVGERREVNEDCDQQGTAFRILSL